jgi:hypothetical protein
VKPTHVDKKYDVTDEIKTIFTHRLIQQWFLLRTACRQYHAADAIQNELKSDLFSV